MSDRIELDEQALEGIVGGAFHFQYNKKGQYACKVDGIGSFFADEDAMRKIHKYDVANGGLSDQELVDWALSQHILWLP